MLCLKHEIPDRPGGFSQPELESKFLLLAAPYIGKQNAEQAIDLVSRIESIDMRDLVKLTALP